MAQNKGIGLKEVAHMAELSRLTVSEEEQTLFARQLDDILGYMDVLAKVDTSRAEPLYSPAQHQPAPREDVAAHVCTRQDVLANAPEAHCLGYPSFEISIFKAVRTLFAARNSQVHSGTAFIFPALPALCRSNMQMRHRRRVKQCEADPAGRFPFTPTLQAELSRIP